MQPITSFLTPKPENSGEQPNSIRKRGSLSDGDEDTKRQKNDKHDEVKSTDVLKNEKELLPETLELISHLQQDESEPVTWRKKLDKHVSSAAFAKLAVFVSNARKNYTVYPPPQDTFSALNLTPLNKVKVVIVGQDPYHAPMQAHGLSFSVRKGVAIPPSLRNIYKELQSDDNVDFPSKNRSMPTHGNLERWAQQGVLLLNTVLTVKRSEANSHKNKGWEKFTDDIIRIANRECRTNGKGVVFLLWGKPAAKKAQSVIGAGRKTSIICTSHPSPLGAMKTKAPFLGSKCFSRCNEALVNMGHEPIDWNVD